MSRSQPLANFAVFFLVMGNATAETGSQVTTPTSRSDRPQRRAPAARFAFRRPTVSDEAGMPKRNSPYWLGSAGAHDEGLNFLADLIEETPMNWTNAALPMWIIGAPLLFAIVDWMRTPKPDSLRR